MPVGTTLAAILTGIGTAAAGAGVNAISDSRKNKQQKELATINQTKPGLADIGDDFGSQMAGQNDPSLSLLKKKRPISYNGQLY